jgi:uncharacterized protein YgbK (DUF1537 family)
MAVTDLTAQDKRQIQDYLPSLSNRIPGFDLAVQLQALIDEFQAIETVTQEYAADEASNDVAISGGVPADARIFATISSTDNGNSTHVIRAFRKDADAVTVVLNAVPAGGKTATVSIMVDRRA